MLSTVPSVSASATLLISPLNPPPHPITVYASRPPPPPRLDRKTCSAARSSLSSLGVWRRGTRRMRTLLRLQHKELVGTRFGVPDFALAARRAAARRHNGRVMGM